MTGAARGEGAARTALLVLDFQVDFLQPGGRLPVAQDQVPGMLEAANRVIRAADARGMEVIYIGNEFSPWDIPANWFRGSAAVRGQPGARLDDRLIVINDQYFPKRRGNAFSNPRLDEFLQSREVRHVILAGVYANACVEFTAMGAIRRGYRVTVLRDAVAAANDRRRGAALQRMRRRSIEIADSTSVLDSASS
ncbi:MAG: cysteine hydrolase family protein [Candidatus Methylomirabilales bacterium]